MKTKSCQLFRHSILLMVFGLAAGSINAQDTKSPRLKIHDSVMLPELSGANRLVFTGDGQHLFCAAWRGNALVGFQVNEEGHLIHTKTVSDANTQGVIKLCLNQERTKLACIGLRSNRVVIFQYAPQTGDLSFVGTSKADLKWPVAIAFSPNSKYLYVADAGGSGSSRDAQSELVTFRIVEGESVVEVGRNAPVGCLGMRDVILSRDGAHCYACCSSSGSILVFSRDPVSGELILTQTVNAETSAATLLYGIHSAKLNADGSRLYCISGRFMGRSGITVFRRLPDGRLELARELELESRRFSGGNDLAVSKDESLVIASGNTSSSLAVITQDLQSESLAIHSVIADESKSRLSGASGLLLNPSDTRLYVAAENGSAVTTLTVETNAQSAGR